MTDDSLSIIITLPASVEWSDYQSELLAAAAGDILNFKVSHFPTHVGVGGRCYLVHRGFIKGWMIITGFSEKEFTCSTTGKPYSGKFIERSGKFNYLDEEVPHKGFQGFRYFKYNEYVANLDNYISEMINLNALDKTKRINTIENYNDLDFISFTSHTEVPAGDYRGKLSGYTMSLKYNGVDYHWKSDRNGIRGFANVTITVDEKGRAYIRDLYA